MAYIRRSVTGDVGSVRTILNIGNGLQNGGDVFGPINMNGNSICGLPDVPPGDTCATSKSYVDSVAAGLDPKESVRYVTVANIANLNNQASVENALDPVGGGSPAIVVDDRILVKDQAAAVDNGIYTWQVGGLVRSADMDGTPANEVSGGNYTFVENGDTLAQSGWVLEGDGVLTLGVDPLNWFLFSARPNGNNVGGGAEVFRDITNGQTLNFRSIVGGNNITATQNANTINISTPTVTLGSAGGTTLVNDGTGPTLAVKGLVGGTNISLANAANTITINSNVTNPTLASAGGTSLVNDGVGPDLAVKGLVGGTNVNLVNAANTVTINSVPAFPAGRTATMYYQAPNDGIVPGPAFPPGAVVQVVSFTNIESVGGGFSLTGGGTTMNTTIGGTYLIHAWVQTYGETNEIQMTLFVNGATTFRVNLHDRGGDTTSAVLHHSVNLPNNSFIRIGMATENGGFHGPGDISIVPGFQPFGRVSFVTMTYVGS